MQKRVVRFDYQENRLNNFQEIPYFAPLSFSFGTTNYEAGLSDDAQKTNPDQLNFAKIWIQNRKIGQSGITGGFKDGLHNENLQDFLR